MAKAGRGQTRRDSKRRVLRPGESVRADGKYQYKYHIDGKPHFVYSWKLEPTDKLPEKNGIIWKRQIRPLMWRSMSRHSGFSILPSRASAAVQRCICLLTSSGTEI